MAELLFELFLIVAAPLLHIFLCCLRYAGRIKLSIGIITMLCMMAGFILPILATYINIVNLPSDIKCATGSVALAFLGILITFVTVPLSAVLFSSVAHYKSKKANIPPGSNLLA
jgi:hypothetical protein